MTLTKRDYEQMASRLLGENAALIWALKNLTVAAAEFVPVADTPSPGNHGDDVRHYVWRSALVDAVGEARKALEWVDE